MEKKENDLIESFIEYFGSEKILKHMDADEIIDSVDIDLLLQEVDDDSLIDAISYLDNALERLSDMEIIDHLKERGYTVHDNDEDPVTIMEKIEEICKELKPRGYIDKEDAKRLICEYIDTWMNKGF